MRITVGYTLSNRAGDYIPMMDGYRPGAQQQCVDFDCSGSEFFAVSRATPEEVAEAVFVVTNCPDLDRIFSDRLTHEVYTAMRRELNLVVAHAGELDHQALSVGDTVMVDGLLLEVARFGFKTVEV